MGFDKDDTRPVVDVEKRTTKVNISMVIGVIVFFIVTGIVVWALFIRPSAGGETGVPLP
ncbi:MAG TPA: hypothetical protein VEA63_04920 [Opitutus sp.]|nr:hypothetical protein [Opitutus sp.]